MLEANTHKHPPRLRHDVAREQPIGLSGEKRSIPLSPIEPKRIHDKYACTNNIANEILRVNNDFKEASEDSAKWAGGDTETDFSHAIPDF